MTYKWLVSTWTSCAFGLLIFVFHGSTAARAAESAVCEQLYSKFPSTETTAEARRSVANVTVRTFSVGHGNQIEFTGSNGHSFLWYPGNQAILPGNWKLERAPVVRPRENLSCSKAMLQMCFQYGTNTYNPMTGSRGAEWECEPYDLYAARRKEVVPGDPIGLATMAGPPFPLPRDDQPLAQVIARVKGKS